MNRNGSPERDRGGGQRLTVSLILIFLAILMVVGATVAWFSIADRTKVRSMSMDVTEGVNLKFDLDPHKTIDEYLKTLPFQSIAARIFKDDGVNISISPIEPVTTSDYSHFTYEHGEKADNKTGAYLKFTLHFMAAEDMIVHLSSANHYGNGNGTNISSGINGLPEAMRISFTVDGWTYVYDPGLGNKSTVKDNVKTFGLPSSGGMVYNDNNSMFSLKKFVNKPVLVHIWLEGTDPECVNKLKGADYSISMKFVGTDENNQILDYDPERERRRAESTKRPYGFTNQ